MKKLILSIIFSFFLTFGLNTAFAISLGSLSVTYSPSYYLSVFCSGGGKYQAFWNSGAQNGSQKGSASLCNQTSMNIGLVAGEFVFVEYNTTTSTNYNTLTLARASPYYFSELAYSYTPPPVGCMYSSATNYNSSAMRDDGSCLFDTPTSFIEGCIYSSATNYDVSATFDDGSCSFPLVYNAVDSDFFDFLSSTSFLFGSLFANILIFVLLPLLIVVVFIRFIKRNI